MTDAPQPRPPWELVRPAVERILGSSVEEAAPVDEGGYSFAGRWLVRTRGGSAFVKAELQRTDEDGVVREQRILDAVRASCMPTLLGWLDDEETQLRVLVTEDLSAARWGVPVTEADADALAGALAQLGALVVDADALGLGPCWPSAQWASIAADPAPIAATGLADLAWIERQAPLLAALDSTIDTTGTQLVHCDMWRQNWCVAPRGAVIIDWPGCAVGNVDLSRAWAEAGVRATGGPPGRVMPAGEAAWAAWMAGLAARFLAEHPDPPRERLLETERREALATLAWACDEAGIEPPIPADGFAPVGPWRP